MDRLCNEKSVEDLTAWIRALAETPGVASVQIRRIYGGQFRTTAVFRGGSNPVRVVADQPYYLFVEGEFVFPCAKRNVDVAPAINSIRAAVGLAPLLCSIEIFDTLLRRNKNWEGTLHVGERAPHPTDRKVLDGIAAEPSSLRQRGSPQTVDVDTKSAMPARAIESSCRHRNDGPSAS